MDANQLICPKCNEPMVQGFMLDRGYSKPINVGEWIEGHPKKSFWTNIKLPKGKSISIGAFRCSSCGYVELYALDIFAPRK
jgi:RNase P subunit RPR2